MYPKPTNHNFYNSDNSEGKFIISLVVMKCIDSIIIDIETLKRMIDISELHKIIVYKHKPDPLSQDENTVIEAFEYYYSHKEAFTIDQNGTVTISLNLLDGETNGS